MNKAEIFREVLAEEGDLYDDKNDDYGDSFAKVRKEYPEAIIIRLMDKLERLKTLMSGKVQKVNDESIEDTLKDMANYANMEITERRYDAAMAKEAKVIEVRENKTVILKASDDESIYHAEHYWENR